MYPDKRTKLYDFIINNDIATEEEITLVTNINGYSEDTLQDIIRVRTEYRSMEQCIAMEPETFWHDPEDEPESGDQEEDE